MKKKSLIISLFLMFLLLFVCSFEVKADYVADGDFMLFIASPGEDSQTQMNFSWHSYQADSYVEVALKSDGNFDNAIKLETEATINAEAYPFEGTNFGIEYPNGIERDKMYVCEAYATNLKPDTEYMYRGYANNKYTETRYFTTAGNDGTFVFAVMADPQIYAETMASVTVNNTMTLAMANAKKLFGMDVEMILGAGDMVSHGGAMADWEWLFSLVDIYKIAPLAGSTGNHDYCDAGNGHVTVGSYLTDNVYNHPKNGCEGYGEACYYFKWDNVLFITLDSEAGNSDEGYDQHYIAQGEWMKEVLEKETYQYVVVMCHRPAWGSDDSLLVQEYWDPIFREYNVDLYFSGHNHDYGRGSTNVGANRGQLTYPNNYICCDDTYNASNGDGAYGGYCLIKVTPQGLFYYEFDQYDNCRDQATFKSQRSYDNSSFDKTEFENNLKIEVVEKDSTQATLMLGDNFTDDVNYVTILDKDNNVVAKTVANSTKVANFVFGGLESNQNYTFKVKIDYKDGTSSEKEISFKTTVDYGKYSNIELKELSSGYRLLFDPNDIKNSLFEKINVYIDGTLRAEYAPNSKSVSLEKGYISDTYLIELKGVVKSDQSEVLIGTCSKGVATDPGLKLITESFEIEVGAKGIKVSATCENGGKILYESSDESIITVDSNGNITAIKAGSAKVIVSVEGYNVKKEVSVVVKEKSSEEPSKLDKPVIKVDGNTLTINKVDNATSYEIYIDGELKETVTNLTIDLSKYNLSEGSYKITVKAKGDSNESELSNEATFTVKGNEVIDDKPSSGCNSGSIQAIWYVISILGLALVLKKKRF